MQPLPGGTSYGSLQRGNVRYAFRVYLRGLCTAQPGTLPRTHEEIRMSVSAPTSAPAMKWMWAAIGALGVSVLALGATLVLQQRAPSAPVPVAAGPDTAQFAMSPDPQALALASNAPPAVPEGAAKARAPAAPALAGLRPLGAGPRPEGGQMYPAGAGEAPVARAPVCAFRARACASSRRGRAFF